MCSFFVLREGQPLPYVAVSIFTLRICMIFCGYRVVFRGHVVCFFNSPLRHATRATSPKVRGFSINHMVYPAY